MIAQLEEKEKGILEGLDFQSLESLESKTNLWLEKKKGKFSASEFHRLMGYEDRNELPKGAQTYATEKAVETLIDGHESYFNEDMERGSELEVEAMQHFMEVTGLKVNKFGNDQEFVEMSMHVGCTPDGLIGKDMGVEGKAPKSKTHFFYLTNLKRPEDIKKHCKEYWWQLQGSMYVTDRKHWYFFSYDPRYKESRHKMVILKVPRCEEDIEKLKKRLSLAIAHKNQKLRELNG